MDTAYPASGWVAQRRHPSAISRSSPWVARPSVTAWRAIAESVMRSAHSPPHHARSSGVAKHNNEAPVTRRRSPRSAPTRGGIVPRRARPRCGGRFCGTGPTAVDRGLVGVPPEGAIVAVARRDQPTRLAHSLHLAERANGIGEMLEHLMRVHDVERVVVDVESGDVADRELDVRTAAGVAARLLDTSADTSTPRTRPGATRRPMSDVIVPGPHPRSSTLLPGARRDAR